MEKTFKIPYAESQDDYITRVAQIENLFTKFGIPSPTILKPGEDITTINSESNGVTVGFLLMGLKGNSRITVKNADGKIGNVKDSDTIVFNVGKDLPFGERADHILNWYERMYNAKKETAKIAVKTTGIRDKVLPYLPLITKAVASKFFEVKIEYNPSDILLVFTPLNDPGKRLATAAFNANLVYVGSEYFIEKSSVYNFNTDFFEKEQAKMRLVEGLVTEIKNLFKTQPSKPADEAGKRIFDNWKFEAVFGKKYVQDSLINNVDIATFLEHAPDYKYWTNQDGSILTSYDYASEVQSKFGKLTELTLKEAYEKFGIDRMEEAKEKMYSKANPVKK